MSELMIDTVAGRWRAVTAQGAVAGMAGLRALPALMVPGAAELSLRVDPRWRRRGIGSRLLTAVREQAAGHRLLAEVPAGSPGEAFCLRHGFRHTAFRRHHLLTYCDVHQAWLGELVDAEHPGYRLTHWTGELPGAPRIEELLRSPSRPGNAVLTAADADGDLAAYAVAVVGTFSEPRARQYGPAVLPGHHGRQLDLWVNAGLIQHLRRIHPHITEIEATAGEDDLLATRDHFGFRPAGRVSRYELGGES